MCAKNAYPCVPTITLTFTSTACANWVFVHPNVYLAQLYPFAPAVTQSAPQMTQFNECARRIIFLYASNTLSLPITPNQPSDQDIPQTALVALADYLLVAKNREQIPINSS